MGNVSSQSKNGADYKAVLGNKLVSSNNGEPKMLPKKLGLGKPRIKSSQLLSKEALAIFSASTPVHENPFINKKYIEQRKVKKNISCQYTNEMDQKAVLKNMSLSSKCGVPKITLEKSVMVRPTMKSSQLLSKEALAIFSTSTKAVHE